MKYFVAIVIGIIVATAVFFTQDYRSVELFDSNETFFEYGIFSNAISTSTREKSEQPFHGHIHFSRTPPFDIQEPYQYLLFHANDLFRTIDLKKYKKLEISVLPEHDKDIMITLYMYVPGFSKPDMQSNRPYSFIVRLRPNQLKYQVKLKNFATPNWWFSAQNVTENNLPKTDCHKMTHICVSDYPPSNSGLEDGEWVAPITEIRFLDDISQNAWTAVLTGIISTLLFAGLFAKFNLLGKRSAPAAAKTALNLPPVSDFDKIQAEKLIKFIDGNYTNPNLTLKTIEKELGFTKFYVDKLMQRYCSINYLSYVNNLQMNFAKELLNDKKSLSIGKIAKMVGYQHVNSFSRTFKRLTGTTPAEFRKSLKK